MNGVPLFDEIKDLLRVKPLKITEICSLLNKPPKEILDVLKSNPYSFDFLMNRGSKIWKNI